MGLDMYLTKKVYVGAQYEFRKVTGKIEIFADGKEIPVNFSRVSYVEEAVGYWRKANAIHKWFVDNVQEGKDDCKAYYVPTEDLRKLLALVQDVIAHPEKASVLLPTQDGFFFGGTEYDEYYTEDLKLTEKILTECLNDPDGEYYYHSSW